MEGHRVRVYRLNGDGTFEGTLLKQDAVGVIVHNSDGLNNERLFIPFSNISHIKDLGRAGGW